jgi:pimeloyl-ACP methyl ester carboxylesterase
LSLPPIAHRYLVGDDVTLHIACAGSGPPVLLLHGFPETWRSWRHQIGPLVEAGVAVFAPDLRGYGESGRPSARSAYHMRHLVADVAALIRHTSEAGAHVVGHDWGGLIAWTFAGVHPGLVRKLVILNAPHPRLFRRKMWRSSQMLRSWYVALFQLPRIPEIVLSSRDYAAVRRIFTAMPENRAAFTEDVIDGYVESLSQPGALTAALNYYRANLLNYEGAGERGREREGVGPGRSSWIEADTLVIWGERDRALETQLLDGIEGVGRNVRVHRIPDAGHFVHSEAPEEVNRVLLDFLREPA